MELESLSADLLSLISFGGAGGSGDVEVGAPVFSDVTFCVEGRQVPAHRCILSARSHFFKLMFSHQLDPLASSISQLLPSPPLLCTPASSSSPTLPHLFVPLDVVGFDAFLAMLRFLYSGQLILSPHLPPSLSSPTSCPLPSCPHSSCSYAVDLLLQLIPAAHFFGVYQLADLVQTKLDSVLQEGVSLETLMRVLVITKKHKMQRVWRASADLVINSGFDCDLLRHYLPRDVIAELAEIRLQRSACFQTSMQSYDHVHPPQNQSNVGPSSCSMMGSIKAGVCCSDERKMLRLQQALDCMDVELVRLMAIGEGLNLDKALALHYSVANCNREVVKALLELGIVDVNHSDSLGRTALHLGADMGNADMIAVLLDHHADPNMLTHDGLAAVDILRDLIKDCGQDHFNHDQKPEVISLLCKADQKRIHLCIELLQSAAAVAGREDGGESSCVTEAAAQILNTNLSQEALDVFMSGTPSALIASAITASRCGFGIMEGCSKAAVSISSHNRVCSTPKPIGSPQFDSTSCPLRLISDDHSQQQISAVQLNGDLAAPGSLPGSCISASVGICKVKNAASRSCTDLNYFANHGQKNSSGLVINPRAVNPNGNNGLYTVNGSCTGAYQDVQSTTATDQSRSNNQMGAQDGKPG